MLPSPAMKLWSISNGFSFVDFASSISPKRTHDIGSSPGSRPSSASSGASAVSSSGAVTNSSPNVRGSTKRSCPPCVNVMTTWVCLGIASRGCALSSWPLIRRWMTSSSPLSSFSTRYLPRRWTPLILTPSSRAMNCFLVWRRTVRVPWTSTVLTRLPTTSRSRPLRIVSTSGSSGIGRTCIRRLQLAQALPRGPRRGRLRLLLRTSLAEPPHRATHLHLGEEPLRVIGPLVGHRVAGDLAEHLRRQLLQPRLVVLATRADARLGDALAQQLHHEALDVLPPALQVHRAEHGLQRVGQDR